jgi:hypothetical protein
MVTSHARRCLGQVRKQGETTGAHQQCSQCFYGRIDQEGMIIEERNQKANKDKGYKEAQRETTSKLEDVTQEEDAFTAIRKKQFAQDDKWKETKPD